MPNRILSEIHRFPGVVQGRRYGIEIEVENIAASGLPRFPGWTQIEDHSLRGRCAELITPPELIGTLHTRLAAVYSALRGGVWSPSIRCGIHIHANVRWATATELRVILQRYIKAEPLLFLMMGQEREQSNFCVPWYRSTASVEGAAQMLYAWEQFDRIEIDRRLSKYSALNLCPIEDKGTIEFRHAPTFGDEAQAHQWLDTVDAIMTGADIPIGDIMRETGRQRSLLLDIDALANSLVRTREQVPESAWGVPSSMRLAPLNFTKAEVSQTRVSRARAPRLRGAEVAMIADDIVEVARPMYTLEPQELPEWAIRPRSTLADRRAEQAIEIARQEAEHDAFMRDLAGEEDQ